MDIKKKRNLRPHQVKAQGEDVFSPIALIRSSLIGLAAAALTALLLLFVGAWVAYSNKDPSALTMPVSLAALYLSLFIGGFVSAKKSDTNKLICGIFFTALSLVVMFLLKLILAGGSSSGIENAMAYLVGSVASAIMGSLCAAFTHASKGGKRRKRIKK